MRLYNTRLLAINLCGLALGGQTVNNLRLLASKFELDQSRRKWVAKRNASFSPFGHPAQVDTSWDVKQQCAQYLDRENMGYMSTILVYV